MFVICKETATEAEVLKELILCFSDDTRLDHDPVYYCYETREKAEWDFSNQTEFGSKKTLKDLGFVIREVKLTFV